MSYKMTGLMERKICVLFTSEAAHQVYTQKPHNYQPNVLKLPLFLQKKKRDMQRALTF